MEIRHVEPHGFSKTSFALCTIKSRMHLKSRYLSCDPVEMAISHGKLHCCNHNAYLQKALHEPRR